MRKKSSFIPADLLYEAIVDSSDDAIVSKNPAKHCYKLEQGGGGGGAKSRVAAERRQDWLKIPQPRDGNVAVQLMNLQR